MRSLDSDRQVGDAHSLRESHKAFQRLAQAAADLGAAVDILGTGMSAVNVPLLSALARPSGGSLTLHAGAHSPRGIPPFSLALTRGTAVYVQSCSEHWHAKCEQYLLHLF